jgi:hypothetical protein
VRSRMDNYNLFWDRWCKDNWKLRCYKLFVRGYFTWKLLASKLR